MASKGKEDEPTPVMQLNIRHVVDRHSIMIHTLIRQSEEIKRLIQDLGTTLKEVRTLNTRRGGNELCLDSKSPFRLQLEGELPSPLIKGRTVCLELLLVDEKGAIKEDHKPCRLSVKAYSVEAPHIEVEGTQGPILRHDPAELQAGRAQIRLTMSQVTSRFKGGWVHLAVAAEGGELEAGPLLLKKVVVKKQSG